MRRGEWPSPARRLVRVETLSTRGPLRDLTSRLLGRAGVVALSLCVAGCGSSAHYVEMDPLRFEVVDDGSGRRVETMDAAVLFREAGAAFNKEDYETAARKYALIVEHFGDGRYGIVSRFNGGLALERGGRCEEAIPLFETVAQRTAGSKDAHDAVFRVAHCEEILQRWDGAIEALTRVLAPEWKEIVSLDRLEAYARRGNALYRSGDLARAERDLKSALSTYRNDMGNPAMIGNRWVSFAQFQVGEIYRELFSAIRFRLPIEGMARDLEDKSNLFIKAQNAYLKAVRLHHTEFAVKAGFQLGALFERMYDDMMAAEVPDDLTEEELGIYYGELRKHVRPLVTKAIDIYERNIQLGRRLKGGAAWVRKTEAGLARLKEVLRAESEKDALEALK
jgi:tetratricopeptide (TPR) repeat protein